MRKFKEPGTKIRPRICDYLARLDWIELTVAGGAELMSDRGAITDKEIRHMFVILGVESR